MQHTLCHVPTEGLKKLLLLIHQGKVEFPLDAVRIACIGFQQYHDELMHSLRDLDAYASTKVISAIVIERKNNEDRIQKLQDQVIRLNQQLRETEVELDRLEQKYIKDL